MAEQDHDVSAQVDAVLDVLAPHPDLPPGFTYAPSLENLRVPQILIDYNGQAVRPNDGQLHDLAERIVTAVRNASSASLEDRRAEIRRKFAPPQPRKDPV